MAVAGPAAQPGWTLGVSAPVAPAEWPAADAQAARALARAGATRVPLVRHGARPALADLVPDGEAEAHARALLAPVASVPALTETLRAWLSLHGSWDRTAVAPVRAPQHRPAAHRRLRGPAGRRPRRPGRADGVVVRAVEVTHVPACDMPKTPTVGCLANGAMPIPGTPSRAELAEHLVRTRIAGDVATPRENNLSHYRKLANGDRNFWLGLELGDRWSDEQDVLAVMAERVGVNDDPEYRYGQDTIDPELTVAALERMAGRLRKAADGGQRVLFATGHPGGLLDVHRATADALRTAGCEIVPIPEGADDGGGVRPAVRGRGRAGARCPRCGTPIPVNR